MRVIRRETKIGVVFFYTAPIFYNTARCTKQDYCSKKNRSSNMILERFPGISQKPRRGDTIVKWPGTVQNPNGDMILD